MIDPPVFSDLYSSDQFHVHDVVCHGHDSQDPEEVQDLELVFCRRGLFLLSSEDGECLAEPGRALLFQPARHYHSRHLSKDGDECTSVRVSRDLVEEIRSTHSLRDPALLGAVRLARRTTLLTLWIHARAQALRTLGQGKDQDLGLEEGLHSLSEQVVTQAAGKTPDAPAHLVRGANREAAFSVLELLHLRYREPLSLADIAREIGYSTYHLCRVFRANTGSTIQASRTGLRLVEAAHRLADGARDISHLALWLGFDSHSHFTATFRRSFGVSPSAYRRGLDRPPTL